MKGTAPGGASPPQGEDVVLTATNQATGAVTALGCNGTTSDAVAIAFNSTDNQVEARCLAPIGVAGTYTITATCPGDGDFLASAGTATQTTG